MEDYYYLAVGTEQRGPYTLCQLQSMWRSGAITANALYCQEGYEEWLPILSLAQLLDWQPTSNAPPAQPPALAPTESNKRILPAFILCLFLGVIGAHAFYAGRPRQGIFFLAFLVLAFLGIVVSLSIPGAALSANLWLPLALFVVVIVAFGDLIRILVGDYRDGEGRKITKWI